MNSVNRMVTVLERKVPDRIPHFEFAFDSEIIDKIFPGANLLDFAEKIGWDAIAVRPNIKKEQIDENTFKDEKGLILKKTSQDYLEPVNKVIKDEKDLKKFEFPDPYESCRFQDLQKAIKRFKGEKAIIAFLRDGWAEARDLHGFAETLMDLIDNPKLISGIIEKAVDYYSELGKISAKLGAEIAFSGDDISGTNGLFMSPIDFKEIIFPAMKRLYKNWHSYGLYIIKHSDGNLYPIMDDLIDTGLDCLHPIDPTAGMSRKKVKREYGKKICIMGNVNCAGSLIHGTKEDVVKETKDCIDIAGPGGGYILASSNSIPRDTKPENYIAMV